MIIWYKLHGQILHEVNKNKGGDDIWKINNDLRQLLS